MEDPEGDDRFGVAILCDPQLGGREHPSAQRCCVSVTKICGRFGKPKKISILV